jgi:cytochrome c-type biogenesis protein CcmE
LICQLNVACYFVLPQHFSRVSVGIAEKSNRLVRDGTIEARQVLTCCPSKYVPKQAK